MSYCRKGPESTAYVYSDGHTLYCHECSLLGGVGTVSVPAHHPHAMTRHMSTHERIPPDAMARLLLGRWFDLPLELPLPPELRHIDGMPLLVRDSEGCVHRAVWEQHDGGAPHGTYYDEQSEPIEASAVWVTPL
jgi:hypothetical protein